MGIFFVVKIDHPCPVCGASVAWQSKDMAIRGHPLLTWGEITLEPDMDGEMHAHCDACGAWLDASIGHGQVVAVTTEPMEQTDEASRKEKKSA